MPRTKKAPGTAVDRRNGRRTEIGSAQLAKFSLPRRSPPWSLETRRAWSALWSDPVCGVLTPVDRPVLLRWAEALERAVVAFAAGDLEPTVTGSMGQVVESPHYGVAFRALGVAERCERQLGVGARNRADLGLAVSEARLSLLELNRAMARAAREDDGDDPRISELQGLPGAEARRAPA